VVAHPLAILGQRLVGGDLKSAVDLARVGDDNFTVQRQGKLEGDSRLADRRRPDDGRNQ
jgi:hypothetical protein